MVKLLASEPYSWPYDGNLQLSTTALIVIDMQVDFCGKGGYVDRMGYDLAAVQVPIAPLKKLLAAARAAGLMIIHTREGHRPGLQDLPPNKLFRSKAIGAPIGEAGPAGRVLTRGEAGWQIIPELAPLDSEVVIDKPGKGSFYATDLELVLRTAGIRNLVLTGITTDVCVHTTMRDANDRGYECLLLEDCCAATDPGNHAAAIKMIKMQGGVFGAVATSDAFIAALSPGSGVPNGLPNDQPNGDAKPERIVTVAAMPYEYKLPVQSAALVMIDFQKDFMLPGGFGDSLGNEIGLLKACIPGAQRLLAACRGAGMAVVHTLEAHKADLSDLHAAKRARGCPAEGFRIGDESAMGRILIRDEPGNGIIDDVAPVEGELQLFKPGKGAFCDTALQEWLQERRISHLLFAGVTTEVCVQTSMREANDRGYECLLVTDATESYFPEFKEATLKMVVAQGGIVGWTADSKAVEAALA